MNLAPKRPRVIAIASHPIQYHVPWFKALARRGEIDFEVAFFDLPDASRQGEGFGLAFNWDIPVLDGYRWRLLKTIPFVQRVGFLRRRLLRPQATLRSLDPDLLLFTGWHTLPMLQALLAANALSAPVMMRGESNSMKRRGSLARTLQRWALRDVRACLAIGTSNRRFYEELGLNVPLFDAPYFVDNERFAAQAADLRKQRSELRREFGIPDAAICFAFAGKFEKKKHPDHLVEAVARARRMVPGLPLHVLLIGAGGLDAELRCRVSTDNLPIAFAGFLNQGEIARAYVASDALVLPSDHGETWGLVVNEAMACGLPAIVSDQVGCGPDLVETGVTGAQYSFGDIDALASLLVSWTQQPEQIRPLAAAAEARVRTMFTVERAADATIEAVSTLCGKQPICRPATSRN